MDTTHFGDVLRAARERRQLALPAVAERTKIPMQALKSLEAGRLDDLPAEVFVRGFIRSYARAVGTGESDALDLYDRALAERRRQADARLAPAAALDPAPDAALGDDESALPRRGIGLAVFVIIVLIIATITLSLFLRQPPESGERLSLGGPAGTRPAPHLTA